MAEPLQNKALFKTLHITLCFFVIFITKDIYAQSLLLPGDIVFVSVNATSNEFEIVPLIDLEAGTEFSVNNGIWDNAELSFSEADEIDFVIQKRIEAGTPLKFGSHSSEYFTRSGALNLSDLKEQLFIYQKDKDQYRFLYALGWGERGGKRDRSFFGSEIPEVLNEKNGTVLRLGTNNNYQYYIRNGASGTQKMLLSFISNAGFWRGNEETGFPDFGTSFNLLSPPVILFDESLSSVQENRNKASLNVAIYEHDGSKLTVEVAFDSVYSSLSHNEINDFKAQRINFTGLIGDAVYEIEVPIKDDKNYEGTESAIFNLQNLSNGRFGDFISHTVLVSDDELPDTKLEIDEGVDRSVLLIHNLESKELDMGSWELVRGDIRFIFPRNTYLGVGESLVIVGDESGDSGPVSSAYFMLDEEESEIFKSSGSIRLHNHEGIKVSEISIPGKKEEQNNQNLINNSKAVSTSENLNKISKSSKLSSAVSETLTPGWKSLSISEVNTRNFTTTDLFYWNTKEGVFKKFEGNSTEIKEHIILVGYFDETLLPKLTKIENQASESEGSEFLEITVESIDINKNGILESTEGLNLVKNNSTDAFVVAQLVKGLKDELDIEEAIEVYKSSADFDNITKVEKEGVILSNEVFWLKFNSEFNRKNLAIDLNNYTISPVVEDQVEKGILEFELTGNSKASSFLVSFSSDENVPDNRLNLKLNKELYFSDFNELVLTTNVAENRYDVFGISTDANNISTLPLDVVSPKSGELELKVKKWTDIPEGWVIKLEDHKEDKSYEIHQNWSLKFTYSDVSQIETDKARFPSIDDRFTLKVIPKDLVVKEEKDLPLNVELHQNYPNPFNPTTVISFYMPEENMVKLSVFNIVGQPVAVLIQENRAQGEHSFEWDASDLPSGIYIYQLEVGTKIMTRKMTLVK